MEESESVQNFDADQHLIAAALHIIKALGTSKNLSDELKEILLDLESRLSAVSGICEEIGLDLKEIEEKLKSAEAKIRRWESNKSVIWDCGSRAALDYLEAVEQIQGLMQKLESLSTKESRKHKELVLRAERAVYSIAMPRLEKELLHVLVKYRQLFKPESKSFRDVGTDFWDEESVVSTDDVPPEEPDHSNSGACEAEDSVELMHPDIIPYLKRIADVMFASNRKTEFCQAFITSRRDAFDEFFVLLGMKRYTVEDVQKMEWSCFKIEAKKWIWATKTIVQVYLTSEKRLCEQVLGHFQSVHPVCFFELSKSSVLHLTDFVQAISVGLHVPEKLLSLLDMYGVMSALQTDINDMYCEEVGFCVRDEFQKVLTAYGCFITSTFMASEDAIATNSSKGHLLGGSVHSLTRYVMKYMKALTVHSDTLNLLLRDSTPTFPPENEHHLSSLGFNPMGYHLQLMASIIVSNLSNKSELYKDVAFQHVFMMNNLHYIVEKIKGSELSHFFEDEWIRRHVWMFQQHAACYKRATWSSILSLIVDGGGLSSSSRPILKERLKNFTNAFEEVYKNQTGWFVPDTRLRDELQISTCQTVVHAYRSFIGRYSNNIHERYIKYTVDDLQNLILDLLEGSPRELKQHKN